jgi:hypothetical protein
VFVCVCVCVCLFVCAMCSWDGCARTGLAHRGTAKCSTPVSGREEHSHRDHTTETEHTDDHAVPKCLLHCGYDMPNVVGRDVCRPPLFDRIAELSAVELKIFNLAHVQQISVHHCIGTTRSVGERARA